MRIYVARNAAEIDPWQGLWNHLHANSASATLFQSFAWNRLAMECLPQRQQPYAVIVESDSGAAIIPAGLTDAGIGLLGEELFDYRDVLSTGDETALRHAWAKLAELQLPLTVKGLRGTEAWHGLKRESFVNAPQVLRKEISAGQFAARHSRLGRTLRRLAREGVTLHHYCGASTALTRWIYRQKAAQLEAANLFHDPVRVDFVVAACAMAGSACDIFTLERSSPLAALITFRDLPSQGAQPVSGTPMCGVRRFYTIYFDPRWAQYSPGTALLFEITRHSLANGFDCDYMTGEQPHKTRFMTSAVPLFRLHASPEDLRRVAAPLQIPESQLAA